MVAANGCALTPRAQTVDTSATVPVQHITCPFLMDKCVYAGHYMPVDYGNTIGQTQRASSVHVTTSALQTLLHASPFPRTNFVRSSVMKTVAAGA